MLKSQHEDLPRPKQVLKRYVFDFGTNAIMNSSLWQAWLEARPQFPDWQLNPGHFDGIQELQLQGPVTRL